MPWGRVVLGDPETPKSNPGDYATTDCVASVFWTDWQFLLIKPSASNFTSGLLKSAWVIIHAIADSLLIAAGVSLSTMLVCFLITKVLILDTRSWANLIFVSPCGDVDTPTTLYVFASILLLALLSLVVALMNDSLTPIVNVHAVVAHTVNVHYSICCQTVKWIGIGGAQIKVFCFNGLHWMLYQNCEGSNTRYREPWGYPGAS